MRRAILRIVRGGHGKFSERVVHCGRPSTRPGQCQEAGLGPQLVAVQNVWPKLINCGETRWLKCGMVASISANQGRGCEGHWYLRNARYLMDREHSSG